jgi:serine/threonine-protein kinase
VDPVEVVILSGVSGDDPETVIRFRRGMARVLWPWFQHAGAARVLGFGEEGGRLYAVVEQLKGELLAARIRRSPRLSSFEAARIAGLLKEVLQRAHERGIVHGRLGPDHVRLIPDGQVKVLDLGIDRLSWDPATPGDQAAARASDLRAIEGMARSMGIGGADQALAPGRQPIVVAADAEGEPILILSEAESAAGRMQGFVGSLRRTWPLALSLAGVLLAAVAIAVGLALAGPGRQPTGTSPSPASGSASGGALASVRLPNVAGLSAEEAEARLREAGLAVTAVLPTSGTPGHVIRTDPAAGAAVSPGSGVTLFVGVTPDRLRQEGRLPSPGP